MRKAFKMLSGVEKIIFVTIFSIFSSFLSNAQYFGRTKPSYRVFNYSVYQTPSFEIYHYLNNDSVLNLIAGRSEAWYRHHQAIFRDTIKEHNPLFIYENHAEFQQTSTVSDLLSESTGGVTEALKKRVVMPLTSSFPQTDHVLGHELVHAFQYNMLTTDDSLKLTNVSNIPLWMIEGMAEYFSLGSIDPHTAMWMRDAVLSNDIPTLKDLTKSNKYFPYRYGHSVMAFIGKTWGDSTIIKLFRETAMHGYEEAFQRILGFDDRNVSGLWNLALRNAYKPLLTDTTDRITGRKILFSKNAGTMNLSPSVSPDGKYIVFISERDVYDLDLFLADANTGKIIRKLSNRINRSDIDALNYLESSGTWSPDGKFAFVVFSEGRNKLIIFDIRRMSIIKETPLTGLPAFTNPSWSPDGRYIAVTGMKNGVSDIYLYDTSNETVRQLTSDVYGNLQPSWSPDSKYIVYVTDRPLPGQTHTFRHTFYNIGIVNVNNPSDDRLLELFTGASNMNPVFSKDGREIYFLSDRDGFRNLYRYSLEENKIWQLTKYMRGITGITFQAPAISVARETGDIVYSYYSERSYSVYRAQPDEFKAEEVDKKDIDFTAGTLPPFEHVAQNLVDSSLFSPYNYFSDVKPEEYKTIPYKPKFKLDYITNGTIGVTTGGPVGTGMEGSISAIFGDMAGDNQVFTSLSLNGEIYDFGGVVSYLNQKRKLKWGASLSHIPNYYGYMSAGIDTLYSRSGEPFLVNTINLNYLRMFEDNLTLFAYYPLSQTRRFEVSGMISGYSYRFDQYKTYYDMFGVPVGTGRKKLEAPDGFALGLLSGAFVGDNSIMGTTGPVRGERYRFEAGKYFGTIDFYTTLADYRKYFYMRPFTLAFRSYNAGRWGSNAETDMVTPLYIGYPWLVRGYQRTDRYWSDAEITGEGIGLSNFFGSKIFIANVELRLPFTGPKKASLIKSDLFMTDISLFTDAGLALSKGTRIGRDWFNPGLNERVPVFSYGLSFRINLFGYLVLEPFYAVPVRPGAGLFSGSLGINFTPGW